MQARSKVGPPRKPKEDERKKVRGDLGFRVFGFRKSGLVTIREGP